MVGAKLAGGGSAPARSEIGVAVGTVRSCPAEMAPRVGSGLMAGMLYEKRTVAPSPWTLASLMTTSTFLPDSWGSGEK